jgi:hypothetical protein
MLMDADNVGQCFRPVSIQSETANDAKYANTKLSLITDRLISDNGVKYTSCASATPSFAHLARAGPTTAVKISLGWTNGAEWRSVVAELKM